MAEMYKGTIPIYDEGTNNDVFRPADAAFGMIERDYDVTPVFGRSPNEMKKIEWSEMDARYDEEEENKSSLEHIFLPEPNKPAFENLDQDGDGYCWAYSEGHAIMIDRLKRGIPYVRLNPHSAAAIIKRGKDEGGWCGLSHRFYKEVGIAPEGNGPGQWPLQSRNLKHDTPEVRAEMAKYKIDEDWYDLGNRDWDHTLAEQQIMTLSFNNVPGGEDFNWWGHSVCRLRIVRIEPGAWGKLILNSWKKWGRYGLAVLRYNSFDPRNGLRGGKAQCNNAVGVASTYATAA